MSDHPDHFRAGPDPTTKPPYKMPPAPELSAPTLEEIEAWRKGLKPMQWATKDLEYIDVLGGVLIIRRRKETNNDT